jgi:hypothetical protein
VHLITLSKPANCISRVTSDRIVVNWTHRTRGLGIALFLTHQSRYFYYPRQRPALTTGHITSCSEWRHIEYSIRLQEAGAKQTQITGLLTSVLRLIHIWKEKFERAQGSGLKKKRHSTERQEKRTYTKREMDKRFQFLSVLRPHLL